MSDINTKKVLTLEEACQYTGFSASQMHKLTSSKRIPHYKPTGKSIFFDREELEAWLLSNKRMSREEMLRAAATYITSNPLRK